MSGLMRSSSSTAARRGLFYMWPLSLIKWRPTGAEELQVAEKRMLSAVGQDYEQMEVEIEKDERINMIKMGSGPPLVLLHGFASGVGFWVSNLESLSKDYTVYALDFPGFGRSSRTPFTGKTAADGTDFFVGSVERWRKKMGLEEFTLLGHSMGAYVAASYSVKHPKVVDKMILVDPWGLPKKPSQSEEKKNEFRIPTTWKVLGKVLSFFNPLASLRLAGPWGPQLVERFRRDIGEKFLHIYSDQTVSNYIYHTNAQTPASGEAAFYQMQIPFGWAKDPLIETLPQVSEDIPTTFIYGQYTWMDTNAAYKVRDEMKCKTEIHIVPKAGHHVYIDNYPVFNELLSLHAKANRA